MTSLLLAGRSKPLTFTEDEHGCWILESHRPNGEGYQLLWVEIPELGKVCRRLHRLVYEAVRGRVPAGLDLDHLCRNRRCCNPEHLEAVDRRTNLMRGDAVTARLAARTHCPKGHPFDGDNVRLEHRPTRGRPSRRCIACRREKQRASYARKRAIPGWSERVNAYNRVRYAKGRAAGNAS